LDRIRFPIENVRAVAAITAVIINPVLPLDIEPQRLSVTAEIIECVDADRGRCAWRGDLKDCALSSLTGMYMADKTGSWRTLKCPLQALSAY